MKGPMNSKTGVVAACVALSLLLPLHAAQAAGCRAQLTQAEQRWDRMRSRLDMPKNFEEKVTHLLTKAAELRHEAEIDGCLHKVQEASHEMDTRQARHGVQTSKTR